MHGVCKEGDNCHDSQDLSNSPYGIVRKYFQWGYCIYRDHSRYEHSKPLKQEEATATDRTSKSSLAASWSLASVGPTTKMNMGKSESKNSNFATVGTGSEDWVNTIEFVPEQPYCGRTAPSSTEAPLQGSVTKEDLEKEQKCSRDQEAALALCHGGGLPLWGELCLSARRRVWYVWAAGPPSRGCCREVTAYKILHRGQWEGHAALVHGAAQQGHGVWHLHGGSL